MRPLILMFILAGVALSAAPPPASPQTPRPPREPRTNTRPYPAGDASRLGTRLRGADDAVALALEQPDCPLTLHPRSMSHDERGSTVMLRVSNDGTAPVTRYTIVAWVVTPDGTVKGSQRFEQTRALLDGDSRALNLTLRTVHVLRSDAVVVAVLETHGAPWKGDAKALEQEAQAVLKAIGDLQ